MDHGASAKRLITYPMGESLGRIMSTGHIGNAAGPCYLGLAIQAFLPLIQNLVLENVYSQPLYQYFHYCHFFCWKVTSQRHRAIRMQELRQFFRKFKILKIVQQTL